MGNQSTVTRREAPRARGRLAQAWIVAPVVVAGVVAVVMLLRLVL